MSGKEAEHPSLAEKGIWYAKIGGIIAAAIGVVNAMSEMVLGGAGVAAAAHIIGEQRGRRKTGKNSVGK